MALLRAKDIHKMTNEERATKINEFKLALIKGSVTANKAAAKTREIKRTIARLKTIKHSAKAEVKKK